MMENRLKRLVFATNNAHKLAEARQILGDRFEILSLSDIGCHDEIPETADTISGNALIKARWIHDKYGVDCFADDTGLFVWALGGEPGVISARYAGETHDSKANMKKLLENMEGKIIRTAHFTTVIVLICDGQYFRCDGRVDGTIADAPAGEGGFGYDPIFIADETGRRFSEMTAEEKNSISHRGRALRAMAEYLDKKLEG